MSVKLGSLAADLQAEKDGKWIDSDDIPGVQFKVSSYHLPAFQLARNALAQRWARKYGRKPVPPDEQVRENGKLLAEHILHDWKGADEEYAPELAREMLQDPAMRLLRDAVENCAIKCGVIDVEFDESAEKNSEPPTAGG